MFCFVSINFTGIASCVNPSDYTPSSSIWQWNQTRFSDDTTYSIPFNTPINYCQPYATKATQISSYSNSDQLSNWTAAIISADNENMRDINNTGYYRSDYWNSIRIYGYSCNEFYNSFHSLASFDGYIKIKSNLVNKGISCYYDACSQCPYDCYTYFYGESFIWWEGDIIDCYQSVAFGDYTGYQNTTVFVLCVIILTCVKECLKICVMFAYFLSSKIQMQTTVTITRKTVIEASMNNSLIWIVCLISKKWSQSFKQDIAKIRNKNKKESISLQGRRIADMFLQDVPVLCLSILYTVESRSVRFTAIFPLCTSVAMILISIYGIFCNIRYCFADKNTIKVDYIADNNHSKKYGKMFAGNDANANSNNKNVNQTDAILGSHITNNTNNTIDNNIDTTTVRQDAPRQFELIDVSSIDANDAYTTDKDDDDGDAGATSHKSDSLNNSPGVVTEQTIQTMQTQLIQHETSLTQYETEVKQLARRVSLLEENDTLQTTLATVIDDEQ